MTLTVGRISLHDPASWSQSGDSVSFTGYITPDPAESETTNASVLTVTMHQLSGLVNNPDEDVYPVTWDWEPSVDGYYAVESVNVTPANTGATRAVFGTWSLSLRRVQQPMFETFATVVLRSNAHTITGTPDTIVGVYPATSGYEVAVSGCAYPAALSFTAADLQAGGSVAIKMSSSFSASTYPDEGTSAFVAPPAGHYAGRPVLEVQGADDVWRPVIGRHVPDDIAGRWRLNNGIVRIAPGASAGDFTLAVWDSTAGAWESTEFRPGYFNVSFQRGYLGYQNTLGTHLVPSIIRNGLDDVTIRFASPVSPGLFETGTTTVSLAAGSRHVVISGTSSSSLKHGISLTTATAGSAITGGLLRSADDTAGNRWVILSAPASTDDTTNGARYLTSAATSYTFAVGIVLGGGATADSIDNQFYGAAVMSTRAIVR